MNYRTSTVAAAAGATLLLAACSGGGAPSVDAGSHSSSTTSSGTSTSTSTSSSASSASSSSSAAPTFTTGMCLDVNYNPTTCTLSHTYEVSAVIPDTQYADNVTKRSAFRTFTCIQKTADYLAGPQYGSNLYGVPVPLAVDSDASKRIVCVVEQDSADDSGLVNMNSSVKDFFKTHTLAGNNICIQGVASNDNLQFVSCSQPHQAESTGGFLVSPFGEPWPGTAKLDVSQLAKCMPVTKAFVGATRDDLVPAQNSAGNTSWGLGSQITACFVQTKGSTKLTKTVYHIGTKPLSAAQ